ncbi:hypothetical protein O9G_005698 [Rozella allomycis CSF55]|uniref:Uncharacterized protein n=1 Tax=Rozella allomycis (strain CSF55) TaxID=988480 RepID=A0A075B1X5_ROZAC|nr:hypothetical protein O9G_005698 [Rozella allomycis CSF55]|eukprot:EPZ34803.1 hypothetical protein O9G_005698 [Rozella allomycis CSF55]
MAESKLVTFYFVKLSEKKNSRTGTGSAKAKPQISQIAAIYTCATQTHVILRSACGPSHYELCLYFLVITICFDKSCRNTGRRLEKMF